MDSTQYLLKFNLDEASAQIQHVDRSYTELGLTIRGISSQVNDDVDSLGRKLSNVKSSLLVLSSTLGLTFATLQRNLASTSDLVADIAKHSKVITDNFANLPATLPMAGVDPSKDTVKERLQDIIPGKKGAASEVEGIKSEADKATKDIKDQVDNLKKATKDTKDELGKLGQVIVQEARSAKSGITNVVSRGTMGVLGGSLVGGALAAAMLGYKEVDRQRAERGEVINVLEATGESLFSGPARKAARQFSAFQERAQFYLGIGRKEIQSTMKQMVDAGFSSTEILERFNSKLGKVGSNTVLLSTGLDKHLNLASGDSMKRIITLTQDYGDSLKSASSNVLHLSLTAQQSGAGISKFIDSVMSGSSALAQYGIDLKEVVGLTSKLEEHYTAMGLDKRYAGQLATTAASGIAQGMSNFGTDTKMYMASKMGLGEGYEGMQSLEEGWSRVKEGGQSGFFVKMLEAMRAIQNEVVGGASREVKIAFWKQRGLSGAAATSFVDEAEKGPFSELLKSTKGSEQSLKNLRKAFKTEGEQVSDIQKDQRDVMKDLVSLGQGILQVLGGLLSTVILGVRSIPALIDYAYYKFNPLSGDSGRSDRIMESILSVQSSIGQNISAGFDKTVAAGGALSDTLGGKVVKIFGDQVKNAYTADLSGLTNDVQRSADRIRKLEEEVANLQGHRRSGIERLLPKNMFKPGSQLDRWQDEIAGSAQARLAGERYNMKTLQDPHADIVLGRSGPFDMTSSAEANYVKSIPMATNLSRDMLNASAAASANSAHNVPSTDSTGSVL